MTGNKIDPFPSISFSIDMNRTSSPPSYSTETSTQKIEVPHCTGQIFLLNPHLMSTYGVITGMLYHILTGIRVSLEPCTDVSITINFFCYHLFYSGTWSSYLLDLLSLRLVGVV